MTDKLNRVTGLSEKERQEAIRWYARQAETARVAITGSRFRVFQDLKRKGVDQDLSLLEYAALCIAIKTEGYMAERQYKSKKVVSKKGLRKLKERRSEKARAIAKKKRGDKAAMLSKKWGVVVELKHEGHSFQTICNYLKITHKISVSRQYLHEKYNEWQNDNADF